MKQQQGFLMVVLVVIIVVFAALAAGVVNLLASSASQTVNEQVATQVYYLAESGLERAKRVLLGNFPANLTFRLTCASITGHANFTNVAFANGRYTVTGSLSPTAGFTRLNGALSGVNTTINVLNTNGYRVRGRLRIDREFIDYDGTTATSFLNATRGVDGSVATTHATNTPVGQNQCFLISDGGFPDLSSVADARREISTDGIQITNFWVSGNNAGGELLLRWNGATLLRDGPIASIPNQNLNGNSMLSQADGWAVGNVSGGRPVTVRWNGTTWANVTNTLPGVALNDVYCLSANNCWAVGNVTGGRPLIANWNGVSWASVIPASSVNAALRHVHCVDANNCMAVGNTASGVSSFYRWNGVNWQRLIPGAGLTTTMNSVFCVSATDCWAVGVKGGGVAKIARWNGVTWSAIATATLPVRDLNSIFCNSSNDCWAVGGDAGVNAITLRWNGLGWSTVSPGGSATAPLRSVNCAGVNDCWAVGNAIGGRGSVRHWDGSQWTFMGPYTTVPNATLLSLSVVGVATQPKWFWREIFV